ncbi:MAG TPA: ABC transporter ATP-binding protein [Fimbriimonadaceae bacterium]|nr:ABC transporter ATP-binding protein [Fimbriimonadaceae bacterium]
MIRLDSTSLVYSDHGRTVHACRDVDLEIQQGEFVGILGPSGSGKSSLLYLMCGLKVPTSGRVSYRGSDLQSMSIKQRDRLRLKEFGFVFQYPYLIGYLNALENVLVAQPDPALRPEAVSLLERLDLADKLDRYPHELSGGEKQRVCVARALLGGSHVIFADEPTAALDHTAGVHVMSLLREHRGEGALVVVTHDPSMLEQADRVITINDGTIQ